MSSVNPLQTQTIAAQNGAPAALAGASTGVFAGGGLAFWDFILGGAQTADGTVAGSLLTLTQNAKTSAETKTTLQPADIESGLTVALDGIDLEGLELDEEDTLKLLELAHLLEERDIALPDLAVPANAPELEARIAKLAKIIDHLTNGLTTDTSGKPLLDFVVGKLDERMEFLRASLESIRGGEGMEDDRNFQLLIALGLTPAEITQLADSIRDAEEKLGREVTIEDILAGVVNIVPAPENPADISAEDAGIELALDTQAGAEAALLPASTDAGEILAAQLNAMAVGGTPEDMLASDLDPSGARRDGRIMRGLELLQKLMIAENGYQPADAKNGGANAMLQAGFSAAAQAQAHAEGDVALPKSWFQALLDRLDFSSFDIHGGLPLSQAGQAAHAASAIQQAGQPHPATQIISATLTKAAQNGGPSNMTIQLDPPEMGRVEIRLEFGPDKTMKAHMIVEKPETFHMLHRDSAFLERALYDAGMDGGGSALSFELAQDGSAFDQNNNGRGGDNDSGGSSGSADEEIIHSTMTWQIDPETGHVRYDIYA